jgi:membrane-bound serine protease (ClpP class)
MEGWKDAFRIPQAEFQRGGIIMPIPAIILIALGLILLLVEIFILPGFGAAGIPGIICILGGIAWIIVKTGNWQLGLIVLGATIVITIPMAVFAFWYVPKTKLGRMMILDTTERRAEGFQASSGELERLIGKSGKALTPLRPAGAAIIQGIRVDVVTQGDFIQQNSDVEVVRVEGNRVVVRNLSS